MHLEHSYMPKKFKGVPYMFIQGTNNMSYYNVETSKGIDCSPGTPHENMNFYKLNDSREKLQEKCLHVMTILIISKII